MNDANLIARVYAGGSNRRYAVQTITSSTYYVPLHQQPTEEVQYGRDERETTHSPEKLGDSGGGGGTRPEYYSQPFMEIKFSNLPQSPHGIVFGCSKKCDVVLPNLQELSSIHFSLTFDDHGRFVVKDLGSLLGTEVTYGGKGGGKRRRFSWIIGGDVNATRRGKIVIKIHKDVQFMILVAKHDLQSKQYIDNVERFCRGSTTTESLLDHLTIPLRSDTEFPTGVHTPSEGPIFLKNTIGRGGFGLAIHRWNVSTGEQTVVKCPTEWFLKKHRKMFREEAENMRNLTHPHIEKLLDVVDDPPQLILEFIPQGPLSRMKNFTISESMLVLTQCLSALAYLHGRQLAHRDISLDNILVRSRCPFEVVLADFGLAKNSAELRTNCGTALFSAPEIASRNTKYYSPAVDIWSLGVVMCEMLGILPSYSDHFERQPGASQLSWCNHVRDSLARLHIHRPDTVKGFLLGSMLVISPEERKSAQVCYDQMKELQTSIANAKPCDGLLDDLRREATIVDVCSEDDADEQATIRPGQEVAVLDESAAEVDEVDRGDDVLDVAPPLSPQQPEVKSTLKRSAAEVSHNPSMKRRSRSSLGFSDADEERTSAGSLWKTLHTNRAPLPRYGWPRRSVAYHVAMLLIANVSKQDGLTCQTFQ